MSYTAAHSLAITGVSYTHTSHSFTINVTYFLHTQICHTSDTLTWGHTHPALSRIHHTVTGGHKQHPNSNSHTHKWSYSVTHPYTTVRYHTKVTYSHITNLTHVPHSRHVPQSCGSIQYHGLTQCHPECKHKVTQKQHRCLPHVVSASHCNTVLQRMPHGVTHNHALLGSPERTSSHRATWAHGHAVTQYQTHTPTVSSLTFSP